MYLEILSKIVSESLLSLYPILVKYLNVNFWLKIWSRFFTYVFISLFFINWKFIFNNIFSKYSIALSLITIIHVYSMHRGFLILESGIAYVIFYLYPIIILLIAGEKIGFVIILAIIGVLILSYEKIDNFQNIFEKKKVIERFRYEGIIMMIISAFTEALIYFAVRNIKTDNHWNHLFISYLFGSIILSIYLWKDIKKYEFKNNLSISLFINIIIGLFGYLLRFYAMSNLKTNIYAPLSYFGILTAYLYGVIINKDKITINKILGTIFIIMPNIYLLLNKYHYLV
jgi:drug/metabolite transporter (DMT)-like permease